MLKVLKLMLGAITGTGGLFALLVVSILALLVILNEDGDVGGPPDDDQSQ